MQLKEGLFSLGSITTCLLFIVGLLGAYIKWAHGYWIRRKVETPKPAFFFGNSASIFLQQESFGENVKNIYQNLKAKGLKYCGYYMLLNPVWILIDLDLIKDVFTKDFNYFTDRCIYANEKNDPLTGQMLMQKGSKWKNMRIKVTSTFSSSKTKAMFPIVSEYTAELSNAIDNILAINNIVEMKDILARYTIDIIGSCAFGIACDSLKESDSEFRRNGKMAIDLDPIQAIKQFIAFTFPSVMDTFKLTLFPLSVINFFLNTVKSTVEYRTTNNIERNDFMQLLIGLMKSEETNGKLMNTGRKALTLYEVAGQAFGFFVAGFETSSTTMGFCLYELAQNTDIQERLRQKIVAVYQKYNEKLTYESLSELDYLENCILETLRKYPPMPILIRECTKDYKVADSDLEIKKGTRVFIPIWGIQNDPEYYPSPEVFDPNRFTNENRSTRHPYTWLPFGEGPRICIGIRFAMVQMKLALATLIMRYRFTFNEKTKIPLEMDQKNFLNSSKGGIWLNVERIQ